MNKRIERLRDKLLDRGAKPSQYPPPMLGPETLALTERVRPFAEAMYLVLSADGQISDRERDLMRGALRTLTEGLLSSAVLERMIADFARARASEGLEVRLDRVASELYGDRADARLALGLSMAAAEAENGVGEEERAVLTALGERLGVTRLELAELLQDEEDAPAAQ
jgi:hypothetical protein